MDDLVDGLSAFNKKNVVDPIFKMKLTFFDPNDPRCAEHDDLIPVDGLVVVPICKQENGSSHIQAFATGLGDGPSGPNISCDVLSTIHSLLRTGSQLPVSDCPTCVIVMRALLAVVEHMKEDPDFIHVIVNMTRPGVNVIVGPDGKRAPDHVLRMMGVDPDQLNASHWVKHSDN